MPPDSDVTLADLRLSHDEVGHLTGLEISDTFMGRVYRPSVFRHPKRLLSFLFTEVCVFGVILIFCLPTSLLGARSVLATGSDSQTARFLAIAFGLSVLILLLWNGYMGIKSREMGTLARLLDEVDKHNEVIDAVTLVDELGAVKNSAITLEAKEDVFAALEATRESLVCALMTEKILRRHKRFLVRREELFDNIETNLATLQSLQVGHQASEYGQLLNEALQIGINVHQEIRQLRR